VKSTQPGLPPAGHQRDEELKRRADILAEEGEKRAKVEGVEAIDPNSLTLESELVSQMDELSVTNRQPGYEYCWVNFDSPSHARGLMVKNKLREKGWEIVCGDMPEAIEVKDVAGNRRVGDVILMRIPKPLYDAHLRLERERAARMSGSSHSTLQELGEKYRGRGVIVHTPDNMDPNLLKTMESRARGAMAANQKLDQSLRDGRIDGL